MKFCGVFWVRLGLILDGCDIEYLYFDLGMMDMEKFCVFLSFGWLEGIGCIVYYLVVLFMDKVIGCILKILMVSVFMVLCN